jgi:hypothetical protein
MKANPYRNYYPSFLFITGFVSSGGRVDKKNPPTPWGKSHWRENITLDVGIEKVITNFPDSRGFNAALILIKAVWRLPAGRAGSTLISPGSLLRADICPIAIQNLRIACRCPVFVSLLVTTHCRLHLYKAPSTFWIVRSSFPSLGGRYRKKLLLSPQVPSKYPMPSGVAPC